MRLKLCRDQKKKMTFINIYELIMLSQDHDHQSDGLWAVCDHDELNLSVMTMDNENDDHNKDDDECSYLKIDAIFYSIKFDH